MTKQVLIVLDNPPLEHDAWADAVFRQARLAPGSNDEASTWMSQDETCRTALLAEKGSPVLDAEALAPNYRRAFDKLYGDLPRMGMYGTAWLVYASRVDACILDWSEIERIASAEGVPMPDGEFFRQRSKGFVLARAEKYLQPGCLLELEPGLSLDERVSRSVDFLKKRGLC